MGLEMGSSRFGSNLHSTLGSSKMSPESGELSKTNGLMDSRLTNRRAQRLLHTIKRSESATAAAEDAGTEGLSPILEGIHQWRLRFAWLDLQLLCRQLGSPSGKSASGEMDLFLDALARAIVEMFELGQPEGSFKKESYSTWVMASTHPGSVGVEG